MTQVYCSRRPCPPGHSLLTPASAEDTQRQVWLSLCGVSAIWCKKGFVWALRMPLVCIGLDSKHNFVPPTVLLKLLLCPWIWGIFFWWAPTCSWCTQGLFMPSKSPFSKSCVNSAIKFHWPPKSNTLGVLSAFARSPGWEICYGN